MQKNLPRKQGAESKKKQAILSLFKKFGCHNPFNTSDLQEHSNKYSFKNHFDIPHLDSKKNYPKELQDKNITLDLVSSGVYMFKEGIDKNFHEFEDILPNEYFELKFVENFEYGNLTSESDTINYCSESGIFSHFFTNDYENLSKVKTLLGSRRQFRGKQIEVDGILKSTDLNILTPIEAKNLEFLEFRISQLLGPYEYYLKESNGSKDVSCLFLQKVTSSNYHTIKIWQYKFNLDLEFKPIILIKKRQYKSFF